MEGFCESASAVKRMVRQLRKARGIRAEDVAIPVVTSPGEVAQVDFGYVGKLLCPRQKVARKAWVFVLMLAHSRYLVADVVFEQSLPTWLRLHVESFEQLGGMVGTVVPDNLKAAMLRAAFTPDEPSALNRSYREVARHYGFKVDPTPPYAPQKKGKVEAGVKYVQSNFFKGREGQGVDVVREDLKKWLAEVANCCHARFLMVPRRSTDRLVDGHLQQARETTGVHHEGARPGVTADDGLFLRRFPLGNRRLQLEPEHEAAQGCPEGTAARRP